MRIGDCKRIISSCLEVVPIHQLAIQHSVRYVLYNLLPPPTHPNCKCWRISSKLCLTTLNANKALQGSATHIKHDHVTSLRAESSGSAIQDHPTLIDHSVVGGGRYKVQSICSYK